MFKENFWGDLLYFMCKCTEDERTNAIEAMKAITGDYTGIIECDENKTVGVGCDETDIEVNTQPAVSESNTNLHSAAFATGVAAAASCTSAVADATADAASCASATAAAVAVAASVTAAA